MLGVLEIREKQEGRPPSVLLPHEEERNVWRQQESRGGKLALFEVHQGGEPLALGPISNLIVVLDTDDEALARHIFRRVSVTPPAVERVLAVVDEAVGVRLGELFRTPEVLVVPAPLPGEERVHTVVEVVGPLAGEPVASSANGIDDPAVVQIALGDHRDGPRQKILKKEE